MGHNNNNNDCQWPDSDARLAHLAFGAHFAHLPVAFRARIQDARRLEIILRSQLRPISAQALVLARRLSICISLARRLLIEWRAILRNKPKGPRLAWAKLILRARARHAQPGARARPPARRSAERATGARARARPPRPNTMAN